MSDLFKSFRALPDTLGIICIVFLSTPFFSFFFVEFPWVSYQNGETLHAILSAYVYWIGPLLLAITILKKSIVFLPAFLVEMLTIVFHTLLFFPEGGFRYYVVRWVALIGMAVTTLLFARRDFIFPFFMGGTRSWRGMPRFPLSQTALLILHPFERQVSISIKDCSLSGLAIIAVKPEKDLPAPAHGERVEVIVVSQFIRTEVVWSRWDEERLVLGLRALDLRAMQTLVISLKGTRASTQFAKAISRFWVKTVLRRAALAVWIVMALATFVGP